MNVPRFLVKGFKVIDTIATGVVYLGKVEKGDTEEFLVQVESGLVILKILYPGFGRERYGSDVHRFLADKDMAPKLYGTTSPIPQPFSSKIPLEAYIYMEYLAPPSNTSPKGWISLHDLGIDYCVVASANKGKIRTAINAIISALQERRYVHGDFRPNNIMIYIDITSPCTLILNENNSLCIKVIDFDWSGTASTMAHPTDIRYPPSLNQSVEWPGKPGRPIKADDDADMVQTWMNKWPPPENVPEHHSVQGVGKLF